MTAEEKTKLQNTIADAARTMQALGATVLDAFRRRAEIAETLEKLFASYDQKENGLLQLPLDVINYLDIDLKSEAANLSKLAAESTVSEAIGHARVFDLGAAAGNAGDGFDGDVHRRAADAAPETPVDERPAERAAHPTRVESL
ncbi:MAG: hypothetical protein JXD23_08055 [Spirochaetales bacterium]|nr:hypothetical protein [Spirochaetales bacterium]